MIIRFLQTCPSGSPEYPFQAGQTIEVAVPPPFLLELCDGIRAVIVKTDHTERAVAPAVEQPEPVRKGKKPSARVH